MRDPSPNPSLLPDAPVEVTGARIPFPASPRLRRYGSSLVRLTSGRLLLSFGLSSTGVWRDGAIMLCRSDDGGRTWDEPFPIYAYPGWIAFGFGGLCYIRDDLIRLSAGRIQVDLSLPGPEPMVGWWTADCDSRDGGESWGELRAEIRIFPYWTEMYGTSNPHSLPDGGLIWAVIGTLGRDVDWRSGVVFSDGDGQAYSEPVVIAAGPGLNFADTDLVQLPDGRWLAVIREMSDRLAYFAHSSDDGKTWSEPRPTGFRGSNIKLVRLRSGLILCAYRDEDPTRRGVSVSISEEGVAWRWVGQLYAADASVAHKPSALCGYPDIVSLGDGGLLCVLHEYPGAHGQNLHLIWLRDRT